MVINGDEQTLDVDEEVSILSGIARGGTAGRVAQRAADELRFSGFVHNASRRAA